MLLLHELNGQSPGTLWLAQDLSSRGCQVYVPCFFGCYGDNRAVKFTLSILGSTRWNVSTAKDTGLIRGDVRGLVEAILKEHPGQSLTVIGNCMSGGLPVELLAHPRVDTVVVCQPAMPFFAFTRSRKRSIGLPDSVIDASVQALAANSNKRLIQFNYVGDHVGLIEKTQDLADRTTKAGASSRHELFIGMGPPGNPVATQVALPLQAHPLTTQTARGHSTITGAPGADCSGKAAEGSDLAIFRKELFKVLGLPADPQR